MNTRFKITDDGQDFSEINFLLGDNPQGERGSFKTGDFFITSYYPGTFKISSFSRTGPNPGLKVPTGIHFLRWKGGGEWDTALYFRDISPREDFLKTMEKTTNPQTAGKRKRKSRGRKSRGRKSRGRKSRGRKSRGRKSRGRKSRGRKSRRKRGGPRKKR